MSTGRVSSQNPAEDDKKLNAEEAAQKKKREDEQHRLAYFFRLKNSTLGQEYIDNLKAMSFQSDYPFREAPDDPGVMGLGLSLPPNCILPNGLYEHVTASGRIHQFWVKDNVVTPTANLSTNPTEYTEQMDALVKSLSGGKGYNTMELEFGSERSTHYFEGSFNKQRMREIQLFLDICEKNGTKVSLGPKASAWLEKVSAEKGQEKGSEYMHSVWDRIVQINKAYTEKEMSRQIDDPQALGGKKDLYSLMQEKEFRDHHQRLTTNNVVTGSDKKKVPAQLLGKEFGGASSDASLQSYKDTIADPTVVNGAAINSTQADAILNNAILALNQIKERKQAAEAAFIELHTHIDTLDRMLKEGKVNPAEIKAVVEHCEQYREKLMDATKNEYQDLDLRTAAVKEIVNDSKLTGACTDPKKLNEIKADLNNTKFDTTALNKLATSAASLKSTADTNILTWSKARPPAP